MFNVIEEIRNADRKKKRFLSALTAAFMSFTTLGSSLSVYADRADSIGEIENVTGNAQKKAELLDVPDADDKFLGMAGDFTIFVKDKFTIPLESADIEGRVAAGKGIENERGTYDIGSKYTGTGATVIVGGGNVEQILPTAANGAERRIFAVTSDTDINKDDYPQHLKNFYIADDLIDFDSEFNKIEQLSSEIKGYEPTGEMEEEWGSYRLIGKEDGVNVFNIPESDWEGFSNANFIQIYVPGDIMDQYVFINVPGSGDIEMPHYSLEFVQYEADSDGNPVLDEGGQIKVLDKKNVQQDSRKENGTFDDNMLLCGHILYNIPDAENVKYTGSIQGSVLAPNANVSGERTGHVSGSTIAKSAESFGIQAGSITFNPPKKVVNPVPETPVSEITVSKKEITGGPEIPGAVLVITPKDKNADLSEVTSPNNSTVKAEKDKVTFTSGEKSTTIKKLPDGEYELTELTSPDGYTVNAETVPFTIKDGKVETPVEMIDAPSEVTVSKVDVTNEKELPGAELTLTLEKSSKTPNIKLTDVTKSGDAEFTLEENDTAIKWVSTSTPAVFGKLPDGEYRLREVSAPSGYQVTADVKFKIADGVVEYMTATVPGPDDSIVDSGRNFVIMKDKVEEVPPKPESDIFVSKKAINGTEELPGAGLTIELVKPADENDASLTEVTVSNAFDAVSGAKTVKFTSGETAAEVKGLPDGDYTLTETTSPDGYTINNETISFSIKDGKLTSGDEVEMLDKPSEISVSKMEVNGSAEIPGAELKLTLVKAENQPASLAAVINDTVKAAGTDGLSVKWTSGTSPVVLKGLPDGDYVLEETTSPDGYLVTESISFSIENGVVKSDDSNVDEAGNAIVMRDEVSTVKISKRDINDSEEIPGAVLKITQDSGKTDLLGVKVEAAAGNPTITEKEITFTSGETETVIKKLPDGKYTLTEITSPDGYTINEESIRFEVVNGETVNSGTVKMLDRPSSVTISKSDVTGDEIPGAELTLELLKPAKTAKATLEKQINDTFKAANDAKTAVKWTSGTKPAVLSELPDGDYKLSETVVPDRYQVTDSIQFTIENGTVKGVSNDKIVMIDELSEVTVSKKAINGTEELPGAKLTIELKEAAEEGASLKNITVGGGAVSPASSADRVVFTSGDTAAVISGLPDGKYTLTETTSPDGYTVNDETISFEVENGVLVSGTEVEMLDKPSEIEISKKAISGSDEVPGAKLMLTLVKASKNAAVTLEDAIKKTGNSSITLSEDSKRATVWTTAEAPVKFKGLPDGEYRLEESVAPDGYTITDSISFVVENGVVKDNVGNLVEMRDALSEVEISKQSVAGKEIAGAKLELTSLDKKDLSKVKANVSPFKYVNTIVEGFDGSDGETYVAGVSWTSEADKTAVLTGLPDGKYKLTETQAPEGYTIAESITFTVENGVVTGYPDGKIVMIDGEEVPSEVVISKRAVNGTDEIKGARLKLTAKSKEADLKKITASGDVELLTNSVTWISGESPLVLKGLPDGEYLLEEMLAPDGYKVTDSITFTLKDGVADINANNHIIMKDAPSEVKISKREINGSDEIPGAKLTVKLVTPVSSSATLENVQADGDVKLTKTENTVTFVSADKPVLLTGLPDGKYELIENRSPDGYTITTESVEFTVKDAVLEGDSDTVVMTDTQSEISISKMDMAMSEEIPGAELKLTLNQSYKNTAADLKSVAEKNPQVKLADDSENRTLTWTSGKKAVSITGLPDGDYVLEENVAPDRFTQFTGRIRFNITDGVITSDTVKAPKPNEGRVDAANNRVIMLDEFSEIAVSKTDVTGKEIAGAEIKISSLDENDLSGVKSESTVLKYDDKAEASDGTAKYTSVTWTSEADKTVVIKGLPDGKYRLEETQAPDGYKLTESTEFTITNGIPSAAKLTMKDEYSEVVIKKTDVAGTEIKGAKLTLTATGNKTSLTGVKVSGGATDTVKSRNSISFISGTKETTLTGIPDGEYVLTETQAPAGYEIAESVSFTVENGVVKASADNVITMVDALKPVVTTVTTTEATTPATTTPVTTTVTTTEATTVTTPVTTVTTPVTTTVTTTVTTPVTTTVTTPATTKATTKVTTAATTPVTTKATTKATTAATTPVTTKATTKATTAATTPVTTKATTKATTAATTPVTTKATTKATTAATTPVTTKATTKATTTATTPVTTKATTTATTTVTTPVTTKATTTAATSITPPELAISLPVQNTGIPVTDITLDVTTTEETTEETTEAVTEETTAETSAETTAETTAPETTPASASASPKVTAKTVSSTPTTGDGRNATTAMVLMAGSVAAMVFALKRKNK